MKHPDYDRAFHETPDYIRSAIELGFMKGKKRMAARRRAAGVLTAAAAFALLLSAGVYGASRLAANRPDDRIGAPLSAGVQTFNAALSTGGQGKAAPNPEPEATAEPAQSDAPAKGEAGVPESTPFPAEEAAVTLTPEANTPGIDPTPAPTDYEPVGEEAVSLAADVEPKPTPTPGVDSTPASELPLVRLTAYADMGANPYFHLENPCGGAELPQELNLTLALRQGLAPCPDCVEGRGYRPLVFRADGTGGAAIRRALWYTESGNYFHVDANCSGMAGAREHGVAEAFASGKHSCPVCMEDWACAVALDAPGSEPALVHALGEALAESLPDGASIAVAPAPAAEVYEAVEAAPSEGAPDAVYYAEDGDFFHRESDCIVLRGEEGSGGGVVVIEGSVMDALREGKEACPLCLSGWDFVVSAVPSGGEAVYEVVDAERIERESAEVYAASGAAEHFHLNDTCGGEALPRKLSVEQALRAGMHPCPDCLGADECSLVAYYEAEGSEVSTEGLWYTEKGRYFHSYLYCSGMQGAALHPIAEALASGKEACPSCMAGWTFAVRCVAEGAAPTRTPVDLTIATPAPQVQYSAAGEGEEVLVTVTGNLPAATGAGEAEEAEVVAAAERAEATEETEASERAEVEEAEVASGTLPNLALRPDDPAYASGDDRYFHLRADCPEAGEEVEELTVEAATGRGKELCPACRAEAEGGGEDAEIATIAEGGALCDISHRFYYTPNGQYYHMRSDCSGMTGAKRHSAAETAASGKRHCPLCIGDRIEFYWLPAPREDGNYDVPRLYDAAEDAWMTVVWSDAGNVFVPLGADEGLPHYYHVNPECFGMDGAKMVPWDETKAEGLGPCPACLPVWNSGGSRTVCYASDGDDLYHADPNCSGVRRPRELTQLAAQAEGRLRCPLCASAPAAWTEVRSELGASIAAAYPGWTFERADEFDGRTEWFVSDGERAMCAAIFRFAEAGTSEDPIRELTLEHGDTATRFFPRSFIESLPAPLSALQDTAHPESIFTLRLEYEDGQPTTFIAGETIDSETTYTTWPPAVRASTCCRA